MIWNRSIKPYLVLASSLFPPTGALSTVAASQSRILLVHVRDSGTAVLEVFNEAATSAGLECRASAHEPYPRIQCSFSSGTAPFRGNLIAVAVEGQKKVVISAFSSNVSSPQGEVDPVIETALQSFIGLLTPVTGIDSVEQCRAPHLDRCTRIALAPTESHD